MSVLSAFSCDCVRSAVLALLLTSLLMQLVWRRIPKIGGGGVVALPAAIKDF